MIVDPLVTDLYPTVRKRGKFHLRRAPWQHVALSIWLHYVDDDGAERAMLVRDDLPASAVDDFETYMDEIDEESRCLMADAAVEFGW